MMVDPNVMHAMHVHATQESNRLRACGARNSKQPARSRRPTKRTQRAGRLSSSLSLAVADRERHRQAPKELRGEQMNLSPTVNFNLVLIVTATARGVECAPL